MKKRSPAPFALASQGPQLPVSRPLPIAFVFDDRECVATPRLLFISENQLPDKVIKGRSQIVKDFPEPDRPLDRNIGCLTTIHPYLLGSFYVDLGDD